MERLFCSMCWEVAGIFANAATCRQTAGHSNKTILSFSISPVSVSSLDSSSSPGFPPDLLCASSDVSCGGVMDAACWVSLRVAAWQTWSLCWSGLSPHVDEKEAIFAALILPDKHFLWCNTATCLYCPKLFWTDFCMVLGSDIIRFQAFDLPFCQEPRRVRCPWTHWN